MFKSPLQLIKKRASKMLDRDRVASLKLRNEKIEKSDKDSAEEFMDIHTQLCEDLPTFFGHVQEFIGVIGYECIMTQSAFYKDVSDLIHPIYKNFYVEGYHEASHWGFTEGARIRGDYEAAMAVGRDAYNAASDISILNKWCLQIWGEDGRWNVDISSPQTSTGIFGRKYTSTIGDSVNKIPPIQDIGENVLIDLDDPGGTLSLIGFIYND